MKSDDDTEDEDPFSALDDANDLGMFTSHIMSLIFRSNAKEGKLDERIRRKRQLAITGKHG